MISVRNVYKRQEIALALWRALPRFRGECSERTFLFRIAHNRSMTWLAQKRAWVPIPEDEVVLRDSAPDPEAGFAREERSRLLFGAIRGLPIGYRQAMMLALEGLDYGEIGQILGISESNAGVRLKRAKELLKKALEGKA